MDITKNQFAQGELYIREVQGIPKDVTPMEVSKDHGYIVGHSETGHHHVLPASDVAVYNDPNDTLKMYVNVKVKTNLTHMRSYDTHAPIPLKPGNYEIRRQREHTPEGWQEVRD